MKPLEILSYNIEFGKKFDDVVSWITQTKLFPDIFCFQEFPEDKIPFFEAFLKLRGYTYAYTPSIILKGIQLGELTAHKESALELLSQKELALGNYYWETKMRSFRGQRSALITSYRFKEMYFSIANVHLSVFSPHSMRYKQLRTVIEELRYFSEDALIMGDFNYTNLFGVRRLFKFMDNFGYTCVGQRMITHKVFRHIPQQLDYVFQKGFIPKEISVLKVPHSDHLPLSIKLSLDK